MKDITPAEVFLLVLVLATTIVLTVL